MRGNAKKGGQFFKMTMGKLSYEKPKLEIIEIDEKDVIITSGDADGGGWTKPDDNDGGW
jgi:hypothetical protein